MADQSKVVGYAVYRTAPFSMTLNDPNPDFKFTPLFNAECLRNRTNIVTMQCLGLTRFLRVSFRVTLS